MGVQALVLWDIDKTLVDVSGIGREIYARAFETVTGRPLRRIADMAGRTERAILADTLALNGVVETEFDRFFEAMARAAHELRGRMREIGRALPGAREAIVALRRDGVVQSVGTGNIRPVAEAKLAAFGLTDGLDLDVGGYGSDDGVRAELVRRARARTGRKYGTDLPPDRVVVIGDTPHDIEGAHAAGAWAIGVATGASTADALAAAGADTVVADLTSPAALVATLDARLGGRS
ncbi:MAG TPA: HAD family hydrolase [Acidimicrobiales bacterium]